MSKANRCVNSIVKLSLLFSLVMAAIGLNAAPDSGTLIVDGEVVHYGDWDPVKQQYKWPLTHRYTCGAVGTYSYTSEAKVGVFRLEFTEDTTIQGECYTRTAPATGESYALCTSSSSLEVYLNGHTVHVLPSGATTDETRASWQSKIYSGESLKIYGGASSSTGVGTLDVHHGYIHSYNDLGIYGAIVNISEGDDKTEVTAIRSGVTGSLTVADSHISISGYSKLISAQDGFTCTGSMLDLVSRKSSHGDSVSDTAVIEDGNYQVGGCGISFSGSVVSIVSEHPGMSGIRPRGELMVEDSCVAIVSDRSCFRLDGYSSSSTGRLTFRNARMTAISTTGNVLSGAESDSEKSVATFGSGEYVLGSSGNKQGGNLMDDPEYYLNPEGKIAALVSGRIAIDGGNLEICAPNAYGCDTSEFTMKNGSLKMVDSIDHDKTVHAILDETAVKEMVSANVRFAGWTAEHSQMLKNMLDHLDAANVGTFEGRAGGVIQTERFFQSGGRIDPGTAVYGGYVKSYNAGWNWAAPVVTGGSLKMDFRYCPDKEYRAITPVNDLGQKLMRVDYEPYWVSIPPLSGAGSFGFPTMAQLSGGPYSAWSKPLVLRSTNPYDVEYVPILTFEPGDSPCVQCLIANFGNSPITFPSLMIEILSADGRTLYWDSRYYGNELGSGVAESINFTWGRFKELAEGCYTLRVTLDPHGQMQDSYRGDNVATCIFTVTSPGSTVHAVTYKSGAYGVGPEQTAMKQNGVALTLGGAIFTRSGYKQTGWAKTDGGAKAYDLRGTYATDAEIVLYPYWTANLTEPAETFAEALGVPRLECLPWGNTDEWQLRIDPDWTCDGNGAATVGNKVMEGTTSPGFSFKITGPTQMKFSYSKSFSLGVFSVGCTAGELYRDDTPGEKTDWKQVVLDIPSGEQTVNFRVLLYFSNEYDYNGFWIDNLQLGDFEHDEPDPTEYHTVTFDLGAHGERTGGGELSQTVMDGDAATAPEFDVADGWTFAGWNASFDVVTSDLTVKAQWKRKRTEGLVEFAEPHALVEEGGMIRLEVWGGNAEKPSSVAVYLTYQTAAAADIDLKTATVDGVMPKGGLKFPLSLSWSAGDTEPKTVMIPVKTDKAVEDDETLVFQLAAAQGVELGDQLECAVKLADANEAATLQDGAMNPSVKLTSKATADSPVWRVGLGNASNVDGSFGLYHAESPVLSVGKSAELSIGALKTGTLYFYMRFSGPIAEEMPSTLTIYNGKLPVGVIGHGDGLRQGWALSVSNVWSGAWLKFDEKGIAPRFVFTQGSNPDVHVELSNFYFDEGKGATQHLVFALSSDVSGGYVTGSGHYVAGTTAKLKATARPGWAFKHWVVGVGDGTLAVWSQKASVSWKVTSDLEVLAVFERIPYVAGLADPADGGKVTGSGYCASGKKVTLKAKANKNFTFVGWCDDKGVVATQPTLVVDRSAKPAKPSKTQDVITNVNESVTYYARFVSDPEVFVTVAATDGKGDALTGKGAGKYVAGTIAGAGKYAKDKKVTLRATANKGYVFAGWYEGGDGALGERALPLTQEASYAFTMPTTDVTYVAKFVTAAEDKASIGATVADFAFGAAAEDGGSTGNATNVMCGVYLEWPVVASALSQPTVAVSGLPSGLKFTAKPITTKVTSGTGASKVTTIVTNVPANTIYGAPTAASKTDKKGNVTPSKVKVTVTTAGKSKAVYEIALTVDPLPALAQGEFSGLALTKIRKDGIVTTTRWGSASLTIGSAGKISGKMIVNGTNCTFTAASYDSFRKGTTEDDWQATATCSLKIGKQVVPMELTVVAGGASVEEDGLTAGLFRNSWKDKGAEPVPEKYQGTYSVKLAGDVFRTGYLSLTVDKKGVVKVAGKAPDGTALSGAATLVPAVDPEGAAYYFADVFCAPSAYKGGYVAGTVNFLADRTLSGYVEWRSYNPQSTGDYEKGGFDRALDCSGAKYNKTASLKDGFDTLMLSALGVGEELFITVDKTGKKFVVVDKGEAKLTFSFTQSTGIWKGTYLMWPDPSSTKSVKVSFEGILVSGEEDLKGFGTYDATSSYPTYDRTGKKTGEKSYKFKESVPVSFTSQP